MFEYAMAEWRLIRRGASRRDRLRLASMSARMHAQARGLPTGRASVRDIRFDGGRPRLWLRSDDFVVFEVFGFGAYDVDLGFLGEVRTVVDGGANVGCAAFVLARRFPAAEFGCVEASPDTFVLLRKNLRRNAVPARAINAALTGAQSSVRISVDPRPHFRRVLGPEDREEGVEVQGMRVVNVLDRFGFATVDLFKLDIEGGEAAVFADAESWAPRVRCVLAEVHAPLETPVARRMLETHGFAARPLPSDEMFSDMILMERAI